MEPEDRPTPDDANMRAFDALMRVAFPRNQANDQERELAHMVAELDNMLCEMRDLVAQLRSSLAELRQARIRREGFKP